MATLFIPAAVGRALRKAPADLLARDVLGAAGAFRAGDPVWVVMRGVDGGQGALARGIARCDADELCAAPGTGVVVAREDLALLW